MRAQTEVKDGDIDGLTPIRPGVQALPRSYTNLVKSLRVHELVEGIHFCHMDRFRCTLTAHLLALAVPTEPGLRLEKGGKREGELNLQVCDAMVLLSDPHKPLEGRDGLGLSL